MRTTPTATEQKEQSTTPSELDTKNTKNYPLLKRNPLNNTPFWIVGSDEIGYKLTWGKFSFNDEPLPTEGDLKKWYSEHKWDITLHLIAIGLASVENEKQK